MQKAVRLLEATAELGDAAVGLRKVWWSSGSGLEELRMPGARRRGRSSSEKMNSGKADSAVLSSKLVSNRLGSTRRLELS